MTNCGLYLGATQPLDGREQQRLFLAPHHLSTHAVIVGMTGSGKTGLVTVLIEEALAAGVPVLVVDVKGDLPNLLLAFPSFEPDLIAPWIEAPPTDEAPQALESLARKLAAERRAGLTVWGIGEPELQAYRARAHVRVLTPGARAPRSTSVRG
jgi:glycosyltransferase involved in cell wall biosynthesis